MKKHRDLVPLGQITKTQGLKGAFRVRALGLESENLETIKNLVLETPEGKQAPCVVTYVQNRGPFYILKTNLLTNINQVKQYIGGQVLAEAKDLAPLDSDDFYWFELVGLEVYDTRGNRIGKIKSIMPTGANDVLVIKRGNKELLLPYIDDVIIEVDLEAGRMTVDPPPGLW